MEHCELAGQEEPPREWMNFKTLHAVAVFPLSPCAVYHLLDDVPVNAGAAQDAFSELGVVRSLVSAIVSHR